MTPAQQQAGARSGASQLAQRCAAGWLFSGLRLCRVLAPAVATLAVLLSPGVAFAAAPLCDGHAQTISAPAPLQPLKSSELKATPCEIEIPAILKSTPRSPEQQVSTSLDLGQRVLPVLLHIARQRRGDALEVRAELVSRAPPGFESGVFRPPRV